MEIEQSDAREILGEPHFVETNQFATAGGTEDHWTFETDGFPVIFMRLRVPYSQMDVHVVSQHIAANVWDVFLELFPNHTNQKRERIFDEMCHPDDPKFYYNDVP